MKRFIVALLALTLAVALFLAVFDVQIAQAQGAYFYTIKITTRIVGTTSWRGNDRFTTNLWLRDAVYVPGTLATDFAFAQRRGTVGTETIVLGNFTSGFYATCKTDSLVVTKADTAAADTAYNWAIIR